MLTTAELLNIFVETDRIVFLGIFDEESSKEKNLYETKIFCIIHIFTVNFSNLMHPC